MSKAKKILCALCFVPYAVFAKSGSVNYSWGADALATMHDFVVTMMLYVLYICYAVASVFVVVAALQIYIKMNTGEDGVVKSIVSLVGACLFIIGASIVFPAFFGYRIEVADRSVKPIQKIEVPQKCNNMFQKFKRMCRKAKKTIMQVSTKVKMLIIALLGGIPAMAQSTAGDYSAGTTALSTVAEEIVKYVPVMVKLCYAIAGVVAIIGAISVYIAMNNEEQDVKKKIMMVVGACLFLIAAAQALPLFFGINA